MGAFQRYKGGVSCSTTSMSSIFTKSPLWSIAPLGVFTSSEEMHKGSAGNVQMNQSIESILRLALNWEQVNGIVINPFGKYIQMTKKMIELLINGYEYNENERKSKDDENN
ncbi:TPA: SseB family protein [Clostridioides difficile]|nr:SseB family protein [Clostridioides difficile]HBF4700153.1 SseB family protein [Clostridioides difficile]HBF9227141.1 SseB family protein [Clostridioides difficile]HBF9228922.1 SseB family protein [Clostridioides difficile]